MVGNLGALGFSLWGSLVVWEPRLVEEGSLSWLLEILALAWPIVGILHVRCTVVRKEALALPAPVPCRRAPSKKIVISLTHYYYWRCKRIHLLMMILVMSSVISTTLSR